MVQLFFNGGTHHLEDVHPGASTKPLLEQAAFCRARQFGNAGEELFWRAVYDYHHRQLPYDREMGRAPDASDVDDEDQVMGEDAPGEELDLEATIVQGLGMDWEPSVSRETSHRRRS
jgi:hypothetical protein